MQAHPRKGCIIIGADFRNMAVDADSLRQMKRVSMYIFLFKFYNRKKGAGISAICPQHALIVHQEGHDISLGII